MRYFSVFLVCVTLLLAGCPGSVEYVVYKASKEDSSNGSSNSGQPVERPNTALLISPTALNISAESGPYLTVMVMGDTHSAVPGTEAMILTHFPSEFVVGE